MSGLPDIDVDDWKKNSEYSGYEESSDVIQVLRAAVIHVYAIGGLISMLIDVHRLGKRLH